LGKVQKSKPELTKKETVGAGGQAYKERKQRESTLRKLKTQVARLEEQIEKTEQEIASLKEQLEAPEVVSDYKKMMELSSLLEETQALAEEYTLQWAECSEQLEEFNN
jgi:phage shock protein A